MASLQKKKVHGRWYWYILECRRINGKPRPFVLEHLGTPETLLKRLRGEGKKFLYSYEVKGHEPLRIIPKKKRNPSMDFIPAPIQAL